MPRKHLCDNGKDGIAVADNAVPAALEDNDCRGNAHHGIHVFGSGRWFRVARSNRAGEPGGGRHNTRKWLR